MLIIYYLYTDVSNHYWDSVCLVLKWNGLLFSLSPSSFFTALAFQTRSCHNPASFQSIHVKLYDWCTSQELEWYLHFWRIHLIPLTAVLDDRYFIQILPLFDFITSSFRFDSLSSSITAFSGKPSDFKSSHTCGTKLFSNKVLKIEESIQALFDWRKWLVGCFSPPFGGMWFLALLDTKLNLMWTSSTGTA